MIKIDKPWGFEEILETNDNYTVKRLTMYNGHKCSLQYHNYKKETIYVLSGKLCIHLNDKEITYNEGDIITIDPTVIHRMEGKFGDVVYLECSTSQLDDVIRIKDDYDRK